MAGTYLDIHCHSVASDDARASVDQYLKWIGVLRKKGYRVDGIVLTEHRQFNVERDFADMSAEFGVKVFQGAELDTMYGHFLVYGINDHLKRKFDPGDVRLNALDLIVEAMASGAIAFPSHPGRPGIGLHEFLHKGIAFPGLEVAELLNGGSRSGEKETAAEVVRSQGYKGTGGSDAHFVSSIGSCLTYFPGDINNELDLVGALRKGDFRAVGIEETKKETKGA